MGGPPPFFVRGNSSLLMKGLLLMEGASSKSNGRVGGVPSLGRDACGQSHSRERDPAVRSLVDLPSLISL